MSYECKEAISLNCYEACPFDSSKNNSLLKAPMKKFMLDKVLPVAVHIAALLTAGGIIVIFSHFTH